MTSLNEYNEKRDFKKTREPVGKKKSSTGKRHIFVVQHHMASRDHYDFRLELDGVLKSWAIPKGPTYDTKDKRLAVHVEDHPYSYKDFEGTIPKGEYGGGTVMLWDRGYWECDGSARQGLKNGNLKFRLYGNRLKGAWTLVKFKDDNWLLIKERDDVFVYSDITKLNKSIATGRTMEEIAKGKTGAKSKDSRRDHVIEGIEITSPTKVIFSNPKIMKYDLALYYQKVSKRMLPYLENRLLSTVRLPDGVGGEKFFSKHNFLENEGVVRVNISNSNGKKEDYYHISSAEGLISQVQINSYEFHIWGSKANSINKPDMIVFDLDPDEKMPLVKVRQGVKDLKSILDELKLKSYLKTSGGKGYHIVVPTKKFKSWDEASDFSRDVARLMEAKWPDKYSSNMRMERRKGKIFIDWVRNTKSATSVAPYSVRLKKKPRVSMPIKWSELDKIGPDDITMEMALKRLKRKDPWQGFFEED